MPNLPDVLKLKLTVDDLDGQVAGLVNPVTGEVAPLDDPLAIADWLIFAADWQGALKQAQQLARAIVLQHMDRSASWTLNRPTGSLSAPSPVAGNSKDQWNGDTLADTLAELVRAGVITDEAAAAALKTETTHTPVAKGISALLKLPDVAPYIEACRVEVEPKTRGVTVK